MSDTPRTDAIFQTLAVGDFVSGEDGDKLLRYHVETLERDLTAARERITRLEEERDAALAVATDPHALWANWLRGTVTLPAGIGDVRQYQAHITRLEEAGDRAILNSYLPDRLAAWTAAKEAKP